MGFELCQRTWIPVIKWSNEYIVNRNNAPEMRSTTTQVSQTLQLESITLCESSVEREPTHSGEYPYTRLLIKSNSIRFRIVNCSRALEDWLQAAEKPERRRFECRRVKPDPRMSIAIIGGAAGGVPPARPLSSPLLSPTVSVFH